MIKKFLLILTVLSLLASIPLMTDRYRSETSTKGVEAVIDYAEILKVASKVYNNYSEDQIINLMKNNGITTVAFYEQTLHDLMQRGIVSLYSTSDEIMQKTSPGLPINQTLLLFNDQLNPEERSTYETMIKETFKTLAVDYTWNGKQALLIQKPYAVDSDVQNIFIGLDTYAIRKIQTKYGLQALARLNSDRPWDQDFLAYEFTEMHKLGIKKVVFEGKSVLGNTSPHDMKQMAEWLKNYDMSFGLIDFYDQEGYKKLGIASGYRTFRVLSVPDKKIASDPAQVTADVFSLGIRERDVRMIYVHMPVYNSDQIPAKNILDKTISVLKLTNAGISGSGLVLKETKPFANPAVMERGWHDLVLIIGLLSFISLCGAKFYRPFLYLPLPAGLALYAAGQFMGKELLTFELFALAGAIIAPSLSTMLVIDRLKWRETAASHCLGKAVLMFLGASLLSLYGAVVVVSLLNNLVFVQYLEQFRGVKALYFVPILLVALYLIKQSIGDKKLWDSVVSFFNHPLYVKHVIIAVIGIAAVGYFLSRSGNEATTLPFELQIRQWLNDILGVRPRTKEIFLGHPFFILGSFLYLKYRKGLWLLIIGVVGQMSMVSTFTHIHTPLLISVQRTVNGVFIGLVMGILLVLVWEWGSLLLRMRSTGGADEK